MSQFPDLNAPNVAPIRPGVAQPPDVEPIPPQLKVEHIRLINTALSVLSMRLLAIIALLGAVGMFSITIYNPVSWRLYTSVAYALVVLLPIIWLYWGKE